jgi:hypothetical protein
MLLWEYCEVAYTPKQIIVHIYSSGDAGMFEGIQNPEGWGTLLAQLGSEGWELVSVIPTKPANHSLYYFKRPIDSSAKEEWQERKAELHESGKKLRKQRAMQKQSEGNPQDGPQGNHNSTDTSQS